ncbi:unnamed protein product [Acanthoscelides obtectus]|uniref:Uncharacterized protein n=1 Tax=Acanthoscelides obtectus TaxID=200917 RepID=A0A9P0PMD0_ACAOB|nr:unnamed protein product [Acanthoscelides obtectus]CAK1671105.1 hypothetical protein AOBTE_LOCUS28060 [Acanthoscelides obtectus]
MKNFTLDMIKNKIKAIRDTYHLEKNKITKYKKSGALPDDLYTPRLVWFNEAATFLEYCAGREPSSSLDKSEMSSVESSEDIDGGELEGTS